VTVIVFDASSAVVLADTLSARTGYQSFETNEVPPVSSAPPAVLTGPLLQPPAEKAEEKTRGPAVEGLRDARKLPRE
jgi:hypothetical protein